MEADRNDRVSLTSRWQEVLLFELADQRFALPLTDVVELTRACALQALPEAPELVLGVLNLRGQVVPVLDLRRRFRLPELELAPSHFFVLSRIAGRLVALRVDRLLGTETLDVVPVQASPHLPADLRHLSGVATVADGVVLIYDVATFLSNAESLVLERALLEGQA